VIDNLVSLYITRALVGEESNRLTDEKYKMLEKSMFKLGLKYSKGIEFRVNRPAIVKHISNIYKVKELDKNLTCSILEQVATDGKKRRI